MRYIRNTASEIASPTTYLTLGHRRDSIKCVKFDIIQIVEYPLDIYNEVTICFVLTIFCLPSFSIYNQNSKNKVNIESG